MQNIKALREIHVYEGNLFYRGVFIKRFVPAVKRIFRVDLMYVNNLLKRADAFV